MKWRTVNSMIRKLKNYIMPRPKLWFVIGFCSIMIMLPLFTPFINGLALSSAVSLNAVQTNDNIYCGEFEIECSEDYLELSGNAISSLPTVLPLYSKLNSSDILGNISRGEIYNLITENPGITLSGITRELKLKTGTALHHTRVLEREGYIKSKKAGKSRRYYIMGVKATGFNEVQDRILSKLQGQPGISQSELASDLDLSRQLVSYHMKGLISSEVVKSEKVGNKCRCFLLVKC